ncbi:unnamed protein product [Ophioblennius macclurei]
MGSLDQNHSLSLLNGTPWFMSECTLQPDVNSRRVALFLLYLLVFMVGLLENLLVVWVNWRRRHSANGVLFCVINVSLSDLMVVLVLPFFMLEVTMDGVWLWGRFLCKVTNLIYFVNVYSSSFFLAAMTLERYLALARPAAPPLFPAEGRRRWALCGGLWAFSLFLALLENVHVDVLQWAEPGCYMLPDYSHTHWYVSVAFICLLAQFLLPGAVVVACNLLIARAAAAAPDVQRGRRQVWLVHMYSLVFVACWLPYHAVMLLMTVDEMDPFLLSCDVAEGVFFAYSVVQGLSLLHCVANPLLYSFLSASFRANLLDAVASRVARVGGAKAGAPDEAADPEKQRKMSNGSTSHSDVAS